MRSMLVQSIKSCDSPKNPKRHVFVASIHSKESYFVFYFLVQAKLLMHSRPIRIFLDAPVKKLAIQVALRAY